MSIDSLGNSLDIRSGGVVSSQSSLQKKAVPAATFKISYYMKELASLDTIPHPEKPRTLSSVDIAPIDFTDITSCFEEMLNREFSWRYVLYSWWYFRTNMIDLDIRNYAFLVQNFVEKLSQSQNRTKLSFIIEILNDLKREIEPFKTFPPDHPYYLPKDSLNAVTGMSDSACFLAARRFAALGMVDKINDCYLSILQKPIDDLERVIRDVNMGIVINDDHYWALRIRQIALDLFGNPGNGSTEKAMLFLTNIPMIDNRMIMFQWTKETLELNNRPESNSFLEAVAGHAFNNIIDLSKQLATNTFESIKDGIGTAVAQALLISRIASDLFLGY